MPSGSMPVPSTTRPARFIRSSVRNQLPVITETLAPEEENRTGTEDVGHFIEDTDEAITFDHGIELAASTPVLETISGDDGVGPGDFQDSRFFEIF